MDRRQIKLIFIILIFLFLSTGCSDLVEVQNRDFVLAMGVSIKDDMFNIVFAGPEYGSDTKEEGSEDGENILGFKCSYINEIEDKFNFASDKRLDYRHLQVIILDDSILRNNLKFNEFIEYIRNSYEISNNVLIFYYSGNIEDIFSMEKVLSKSIGDYIKKLDDNNREKFGIKPVTIGNLINASSQKKPLMIPSIKTGKAEVKVSGAAVFYDDNVKLILTEEEYLMELIAKGEGKDYVINAMNAVPVVIKDVSSKFIYEYEEERIRIYINIEAGIEKTIAKINISEDELSLEVSEYLLNGINNLLESCMKKEQLDILRIYDMASIKCRQAFIDYEGRREEFLKDVEIVISVEVQSR